MTDKQLYLKLDELFFNFEQCHFCNNGVWPRRVNLVFSFADYIDNLSDDDIGEHIESDNKKLIARFRSLAKHGIDKWLNENMKTLMF